MTRWARQGPQKGKTPLPASEWSELKNTDKTSMVLIYFK